MSTMEDYFNLNLTTASFILNTLNFTDSSTESLNTFNYTQNQRELNEPFVTSTIYLEEITRMIHVIVRPILIICGTIVNLLSFYVMRRGSLKEVSTCFYMSILALVDTGKPLWRLKFKSKENIPSNSDPCYVLFFNQPIIVTIIVVV